MRHRSIVKQLTVLLDACCKDGKVPRWDRGPRIGPADRSLLNRPRAWQVVAVHFPIIDEPLRRWKASRASNDSASSRVQVLLESSMTQTYPLDCTLGELCGFSKLEWMWNTLRKVFFLSDSSSFLRSKSFFNETFVKSQGRLMEAYIGGLSKLQTATKCQMLKKREWVKGPSKSCENK